jgi:hypothetical protein
MTAGRREGLAVSIDRVTPIRAFRRFVGGILRRIEDKVAVLASLREAYRLERARLAQPDADVGPVIDGADVIPVADAARSASAARTTAPEARPWIWIGALAAIPSPIVDVALVINPIRLVLESPEFRFARSEELRGWFERVTDHRAGTTA